MLDVPPGLTELGAALNTTLLGAPAVKLTGVVLLNPEIVALTLAVNIWVPALSVTEAMPFTSVIALGLDSVPAVVAKATVTPGAASPLLSFTSARITVLPPTGMLPLFALVVIEPITVVLLTVMLLELVLPLLLVASMVSVPLLEPAV